MSKIMVVGGNRSDEHIKYFGNHVRIDGAWHVLHRVWFKDGTNREYYVREGYALMPALHSDTVERIEVCG